MTSAARLAPWLAALAGLAFTLLAFWPGYLSWDSAYQWWQARGGPLDPGHPPVMVRLWRLAREVLPDPGGMLLLQCLLYWGAVALFVRALGGTASRCVLLVLLLGFWPPLLGLLPHLWKDVWLAGGLALAVALLAEDLRAPHRGWRWAALLAVALACAFRLNALPAALPLLLWIAWREPALRAVGRAATMAAGLLLVLATSALLNRVPESQRSPTWTSLALWDIAAVSIAEERLLFPSGWAAPGLTLADLRRDFQPHVNVPSFSRGQLLLNPYFPHDDDDYARLRATWVGLPFRHTRAWAAHRLRLSAYLLGLKQGAHPDFLVLQPGVVAFRDNPAVARNDGLLNRKLQASLDGLVDTPLFAPWPYLLLSLGVLATAAWRRDGGALGLAAATAASGLCLALPLVFFSPSSDFRYLGWSVMASQLSLLLAVACARRDRH